LRLIAGYRWLDLLSLGCAVAISDLDPAAVSNPAFWAMGPPWSLKTGQCHWRDQLGGFASAARVRAAIFFSSALALHADQARHAGNASLAGIGGLRRLTLIEGLADGLREEHDQAAESKPTFAGCHRSGQKLAG